MNNLKKKKQEFSKNYDSYKDIVDQSAEWRFYGADDNQHTDPTRCGLPINPLLKEDITIIYNNDLKSIKFLGCLNQLQFTSTL